MTEVDTLPKNVLVYGTLKRGGHNNYLLAKAKFVAPAVTVSDSWKMLNGGYPMVLSGGTFKVRGEIFEVNDHETLRNLDRLEGTPHLFHREPVTASLITNGNSDAIGGEVEAFMYVGNTRFDNGRNRMVSPNDNNECSWDN